MIPSNKLFPIVRDHTFINRNIFMKTTVKFEPFIQIITLIIEIEISYNLLVFLVRQNVRSKTCFGIFCIRPRMKTYNYLDFVGGNVKEFYGVFIEPSSEIF